MPPCQELTPAPEQLDPLVVVPGTGFKLGNDATGDGELEGKLVAVEESAGAGHAPALALDGDEIGI